MTNQRKYQLANLASGKCERCPRKRVTRADGSLDSRFCRAHRAAYKLANRERMRRLRQRA